MKIDEEFVKTIWVIIRDSATFGVATVIAMVSLITYQRNARTKASEFLWNLHQSFFVSPTYKKVRIIVDRDGDMAEEEMGRLTTEYSEDFTDFLNFFELVAYLKECGTLKNADVEALLGYYLNLLSRPRLRKYVKDKQNGFEQLDNLLTKREAEQEIGASKHGG